MKNIFKILLVLMLASVSTGVLAQQEVLKSSVRKYSVGTADKATSNYFWQVFLSDGSTEATPGVHYNAYSDLAKTTPITLGETEENRYIIYIEWLGDAETNYVVKVIEKDASTDCYDASINEFTHGVKIIANDFSVSVAWSKDDGSTTDLGAANRNCAIDGANTVAFKVTRAGGKPFSTWKFKYQYKLDSGDWSDVSTEVEVVGNGTDANNETVVTIDNTMGLTKDKLIGDGVFNVYFRVVYAHDFYNTPANNVLETEVVKTMDYTTTTNPKNTMEISKIPVGQSLQFD